MANPNVTFYRQTDGVTDQGAITFDTTNNIIHIGTGSSTYEMYGVGRAVRYNYSKSVTATVSEGQQIAGEDPQYIKTLLQTFTVPGLILSIPEGPAVSGNLFSVPTYSISVNWEESTGLTSSVTLHSAYTSTDNITYSAVLSVTVVYLPTFR